jgi:hypothetical protein
MHVSCLDVPRAQGHIPDIKAKYGENSNAWRVRVLGQFPTADDETTPCGAWTSLASETTLTRRLGGARRWSINPDFICH